MLLDREEKDLKYNYEILLTLHVNDAVGPMRICQTRVETAVTNLVRRADRVGRVVKVIQE